MHARWVRHPPHHPGLQQERQQRTSAKQFLLTPNFHATHPFCFLLLFLPAKETRLDMSIKYNGRLFRCGCGSDRHVVTFFGPLLVVGCLG
jgi:hypothetical protein